jgi:subtilisin family serine protease
VATVIAAGNSGYSKAVSTPGCISSAVTVSTVSDSDALWTGHNRSSLTDVLAPGITITSSVPDTQYGGTGVGDYRSKSGTSMAAPHVTGSFALLSAAAPNATVQQILTALTATGRELTDPKTGQKYRRIDLDDALARLGQP